MKCEVVLRDNPNRIFRPGELMEGSIVIKCRRETVVNEINCNMKGYARCAWSLETSMYYFQTFSGRIELLNANLLLLHKPRYGQQFPKGSHIFNFIFPLPDHLPSTFKSLEGIVKYQMDITVKRFGKSDCEYVYPFNVMRVVDLNAFNPPLTRPLLRVMSKEFAIDYTSKALYMTAMIPQQGFVPNQMIDIRTQIDNRSIVYVKYIKISLKKVIAFTSQNPNVQTRQQSVTEARVYGGDVPAHQKRTFIKYLKVPLLPPNINCEIIRVDYEIQVKAKTVGVTRSPVLRIPIQIGSIPLLSDTHLDYELDSGMPSIFRRLEIAPMSYEECMSSTATTPDSDLIDLNLPSYEEAIRDSITEPQDQPCR